MSYQPLQVAAAAGTLYAAPLGTTEPTSVTGNWPSGWALLGYTDQGSTFEEAIQTAGIEVEEEIYALRQITTGKTATLAASLAQINVQNILLSLNGGLGSSVLTGVQTAEPDGTIRLDPPTPGNEVRVMLGWDYLPKGGTTPLPGQFPGGRLILRQCLKTGNTQIAHRKGNNKMVLPCTWTAEIPSTNLPIYSHLLPQALTAA